MSVVTAPSPQAEAGDLVRAALRSEEGAWNALMGRFDGRVRSIARSYGLRGDDVSDVSQVVWMRLLDHLDRLHDPDRVAGWLTTTTRHECLRTVRQHGRTRPTADPAVLDSDDQGTDPVATLAAEQRSALLSQVVETLSSQHQALVRVMMLDPAPTYRETANRLGIPIGSIGPTRQRCLAVLRSKCAAAGIEP